MSSITVLLVLIFAAADPTEQAAKPSAALPGTSKRERYAEQAEIQRLVKIGELEDRLRERTACLALIKRTRVRKTRPPGATLISERSLVHSNGKYWFKNGTAKRKTLRALEKQVKSLQERVRAVKNQTQFVPDIAFGDLRVGNIGEFRSGSSGEVFQIIDDDEVLIRWARVLIWFRGIDATNLVDEQSVKLAGLFEITGTETYGTVLGGTKTVLVAEHFVLPKKTRRSRLRPHDPSASDP